MNIVKRTILIGLLGLLTVLAAGPACAQNDKLQHFGLGYLSGAIGMSLSPDGDGASRRTYGLLTALAVGAAKEASDPTFSGADLAADMAGGLAAVTFGSSIGSPRRTTLSFTGVRVENKTVFAAVYTIRF